MTMTETLTALTGKKLEKCSNEELYLALLKLVNEKSAQQVRPVEGRKLYYISAEFLIGKLLSNNLINLGLYDEVRAALAAAVAVGRCAPDRTVTVPWEEGEFRAVCTKNRTLFLTCPVQVLSS